MYVTFDNFVTAIVAIFGDMCVIQLLSTQCPLCMLSCGLDIMENLRAWVQFEIHHSMVVRIAFVT
jgi:hypothetical protein